MSVLFSILIWAIVIWLIIYKIIKSSSGTRTGSGASAAKSKARTFTNYRPHKDIVSVSRDMGDKRGSILRDDKNNDWLARQLRDEHKAFKATSEMFDLKIEHASHCDARLLEQFHRRNCDASGVDLANGSSTMKRSIEDQ
ncbi:MAG: hypothetical protein IJI51_06255 [Lachnospiraceae bacterium]|nr:hypothetical protein [Lachnospiraceae bacterium]